MRMIMHLDTGVQNMLEEESAAYDKNGILTLLPVEDALVTDPVDVLRNTNKVEKTEERTDFDVYSVAYELPCNHPLLSKIQGEDRIAFDRISYHTKLPCMSAISTSVCHSVSELSIRFDKDSFTYLTNTKDIPVLESLQSVRELYTCLGINFARPGSYERGMSAICTAFRSIEYPLRTGYIDDINAPCNAIESDLE